MNPDIELALASLRAGEKDMILATKTADGPLLALFYATVVQSQTQSVTGTFVALYAGDRQANQVAVQLMRSVAVRLNAIADRIDVLNKEAGS